MQVMELPVPVYGKADINVVPLKEAVVVIWQLYCPICDRIRADIGMVLNISDVRLQERPVKEAFTIPDEADLELLPRRIAYDIVQDLKHIHVSRFDLPLLVEVAVSACEVASVVDRDTDPVDHTLVPPFSTHSFPVSMDRIFMLRLSLA